ncbi:PREDICTED: putative invertase inhibitor [Nelumbo nucifera]|uniref:Invertase inhibitor n=2 Tax=Nelumbo nucifera TaxID=4432 RepID=A0A1U8Q860_NELNU|nr:PREDICTED: putative invertase inhibitor [Nelumbo nucifera]DAD33232.1 TPA_asm: hypothetical protein HUJ06_012083 [Nelumbo nucifera]
MAFFHFPAFLFFLSFLLSLSTPSPSPSYAEEDNSSSSGMANIKDICEESLTNYYNLCVSSLESDPRSFKVKWKDLPKISVELALANVSHTHSYTRKLLENTTDPVARKCFDLCYKNYGQTIRLLRSSLVFFDNEDYDAILSRLWPAMHNVSGCMDELKRKLGGLKLALNRRTEISKGLTSISFALVSFLKV